MPTLDSSVSVYQSNYQSIVLQVVLTIVVAVAIALYFRLSERASRRDAEIQISIDDESGDGTKEEATASEAAGNLEISTEVLGYGSHGTVVYKGLFHGREIAVKRLLLDFYDVAFHEAQLLIESDYHPNVIRYFCKEESPQFLYIGLELCECSLYDLFESNTNGNLDEIKKLFDPKTVAEQITNGLDHLHQHRIIHRDIKPQNILVSKTKTTYKYLISDFGLGKKLTDDQSSFRNTVGHSGGTSGWSAPETIFATASERLENERENNNPNDLRLTKAVDVFSLGLVFYYMLTNGDHPFGERIVREINIAHYNMDSSKLDWLNPEAYDLILKMLDRNPARRPNCTGILAHPFFWSDGKRLQFLSDLSDRLDIENKIDSDLPALFETATANILPERGWHSKLHRLFCDNLGKYRKYDTHKLLDLLRAIRNKKNHYQDLPQTLKEILGRIPGEYLQYFTSRFPTLIVALYNFGAGNNVIRQDSILAQYYEHF